MYHYLHNIPVPRGVNIAAVVLNVVMYTAAFVLFILAHALYPDEVEYEPEFLDRVTDRLLLCM